MQRKLALLSPRLTTLYLGVSALALVAGIICFPDQAFQASIRGLHLWWTLVFPALLPFLILMELMRGLGLLHGIGSLLEPLLRPLFRLPGIGGWIVTVGYTTGTPAGAAAVGELRKDGTLTRDEAERLLSASHVFSPVFIIGVIGAGFLQNPSAGLALALIHYASALLLMLLHRFGIGMDGGVLARRRSAAADPSGWMRQSFDALRTAKSRDGRTFGKLLGDSVTASIGRLFIIGGCMMIFSVLLQMVSLTGFASAAAAAGSLLGIAPVDAASLVTALLTGLMEPHLGAYAMSQPMSLQASVQYALLSLLIAWGGFSTHAQVKSLTAATDLRYSRFLLSRLQHSAIAFLLTLLSWRPLTGWLAQEPEQPVIARLPAIHAGWSVERNSLWPLISPMMLQFGIMMLVLLILSVFAAFLFTRNRKNG